VWFIFRSYGTSSDDSVSSKTDNNGSDSENGSHRTKHSLPKGSNLIPLDLMCVIYICYQHILVDFSLSAYISGLLKPVLQAKKGMLCWIFFLLLFGLLHCNTFLASIKKKSSDCPSALFMLLLIFTVYRW